MQFHLRLLANFIRNAAQQELAFRFHFIIQLFYTLLNLTTGILGLSIIFSQVPSIKGWQLGSALVLVGIFQILGALRGLVFGPSLDSLVGYAGALGNGGFDFILLRPVNVQFMASLRNWNLFSLLDVLLGCSVLGAGILALGQHISWLNLIMFMITISAAITILYSLLLIFTSLAFWRVNFEFTWVFNSLFQLARYPADVYPGWLRLIITWIIPVGFITTIPAQAISQGLSPIMLLACCMLALGLLSLATLLFHIGLRKYSSASS